MKISRLHDGNEASDEFVDAFNLLTDKQQIAFLVDVATEDEELRKLMLDTFRQRGLLE